MRQITFVSIIIAFLIPNSLGGGENEEAMKTLTEYIKQETGQTEIDLEEETDDGTVGDVSIFTKEFYLYASEKITKFPSAQAIVDQFVYTVCGNASDESVPPIVILEIAYEYNLNLKPTTKEAAKLLQSTKTELKKKQSELTNRVVKFLIQINFNMKDANVRKDWLATVDTVAFGLCAYTNKGSDYYMATVRLGPFKMTKFAKDLFLHWGNNSLPVTAPKKTDVYAVSVAVKKPYGVTEIFSNKDFLTSLNKSVKNRKVPGDGLYSMDISFTREHTIEAALVYAKKNWGNEFTNDSQMKTEVGVIRYVEDSKEYYLVAFGITTPTPS